MSLSRILNDDPTPMSAPPLPASLIPLDPALMDTSPRMNSSVSSPPHRSHHHGQPDRHGEPVPPPRGYTYQPLAYQGAGGWDPYTGEWVQGDIFPLGPGGNYYPDRVGRQRFVSSQEQQRDTSTRIYYKDEDEDEEDEDDTPRKRRKGGAEDTDYQPPGQRRVSCFYLLCLWIFINLLAAWSSPIPSQDETISSSITTWGFCRA
jgi:chromatin-remodeling ATPase INO80